MKISNLNKLLDDLVFAVPEGVPSVHLEVLDGQVSRNVITGGNPGRILRWAKQLDRVELFPYEIDVSAGIPLIRHIEYLSESKVIEMILGDRLQVVINGLHRGEELTLANTYMGPSTTAIIGTELVRYCKSSDMLFMRGGTSGAMHGHINVGDMMVSKDREYTNDGVSSDIVFPEMFPTGKFIAVPSPDVAEILEQVSNDHKLGFQTVYAGRTKTVRELFWTNRKYREILADPEKLAIYQAQSGEYPLPLAISMEYAAIIAIAKACKDEFGIDIRHGQNLIASDIVAPKTTPGIDREVYEASKGRMEPIQGAILFDAVLKVRYG